MDRFNKLDGFAVDLVAKLAPWAAPIPTAYLVGRATVEHLAWPVWVGFVAAVIVESLGLATTSTALTLREYNAEKRKSDPSAPFVLAAALVGVYLVVAVGLTVALDIVPALAVYSPAIFPLLSLTGVTVLALRGDHRRRVAEIEKGKAERRKRRAERKRNGGGTKPARAPEPVTAQAAHYTATSATTRERARAVLLERPGISGSELGRTLGRSERLGRKLKAELLPELDLPISGNGRKEEGDD